MSRAQSGIGQGAAAAKRGFDILFSAIGLVLTFWLIVLGWIAATLDTRANGFYTQNRVGQHGKVFKVVKLRTMRPGTNIDSTVTVQNDPRVTNVGWVLRRTKIDELPQLFNVLIGQMSFVGPRPDVPGFADQLRGEDRVVLTVRPGITGPATLRYRNEESLLASQDDPERYNIEVVYPEKVRLNREYIENYSFFKDFRYIWKTLFG